MRTVDLLEEFLHRGERPLEHLLMAGDRPTRRLDEWCSYVGSPSPERGHLLDEAVTLGGVGALEGVDLLALLRELVHQLLQLA